MSPQSLVLSLQPRFAELVFDGTKRTELRRRFAEGLEGCDVFVYVTSPVRELRGGFRVEAIWKGPPEELWEKVSETAGVSRAQFDAYYRGKEVAYALGMTDVWEFKSPSSLNTLRERLGDFVVPQSWRYVRDEESRWLRRKRKVQLPSVCKRSL